MDDFGEGYAWMGAHPDRKSLEATPALEWPSWSTYWATHEPEEVAVRLRNGLIGEAGSVSTFLTPRSSGRRAGTPEKRWKRLLEPRGLYLAAGGLPGWAAGHRAWPGLPDSDGGWDVRGFCAAVRLVHADRARGPLHAFALGAARLHVDGMVRTRRAAAASGPAAMVVPRLPTPAPWLPPLAPRRSGPRPIF